MDIHKAIRAIHNSVVTINGDTENDIIAKDENGNEITINWTQVNAWSDPDQYKIDRESEYPSIQEQLDLQYHDQVNGTTKWKDKIKSIKDKYPKPSEE
jgi:hypothetical protein